MFIVQDTIQCLQVFIIFIYVSNQHCVVVDYLKRISLLSTSCVDEFIMIFIISSYYIFYK
jgi:hypothetical protein